MKTHLWRTAVISLLLVLTVPTPAAEPDKGLGDRAAPGYQVQTLTEGLVYPWALAFLPDGRLLVTERGGHLRLISADGTLRKEPIAGLPAMFRGNQAGLLGLALAPDFAQSKTLYFSYVCGDAKANSVCLASAQFGEHRLEHVKTLFQAQPALPGDRQYGGRITLLPDRTLILTLGDLYDFREQAQGLGSHIGKLVRLNGDGTVPGDNPFVNHSRALPEIYSLGHRNPLGIVYDQTEDRLLSHENGAQGGDELNLIKAGANYGWPIVTFGLEYSGDRSTPYHVLPAFESPLLHWTPSIAPSGLAHYDADLFPEWKGSFLVSALVGMGVHRVKVTPEGARNVETLFGELKERIRDVRVGPEGALYLLTDSHEARVLRVVPSAD